MSSGIDVGADLRVGPGAGSGPTHGSAPTPAAGRLAATFARLREKGSLALVGWQTIGYPAIGATERLVPALFEGGFDLFELGIPFSDPMADGATIQRSSQAALDNGTTPAHCFQAIRTLRKEGLQAPLLFMSYFNTVLAMGLDRFAGEAADAGLDGLTVPDLPPEEADELVQALDRAGIDPIFFAAPTSTEDRLRAVAARARGFIYCVSLTGVTGARANLSAALPDYLARVRKHTDLPLAVGFGISRPEHVAGLRGHADGAIVGSEIINVMERTSADQHADALRRFAASLREAAGPR